MSNLGRILLVEDDPKDVELTLTALEDYKLANEVVVAHDGAEALDYIAAVNHRSGKPASLPRLILLDLVMHKIGGLHVLRQLKSDARTKSIPIVVLTSSQMAIEIVESYQLGVNSYVIKPSEPKKFTEVVAQVGHYWLAINEAPPL